MKIEPHRSRTNNICTLGRFVVDGQRAYYSMELPLLFEGQEDVPDKTCVPAALYLLRNLFSGKHNCLMPHLVGVRDRSNIEVHAASRPREILGCIAIGNQTLQFQSGERRRRGDQWQSGSFQGILCGLFPRLGSRSNHHPHDHQRIRDLRIIDLTFTCNIG